MDKYEYKSKTERMLELMESGAYSRAAAIADEIDWRRVRNAVMLSNVSEIYEKTGEYQKGYDILTLAYQRAEGSRKIISRLCGLALKTGNVDEAIDFYDDTHLLVDTGISKKRIEEGLKTLELKGEDLDGMGRYI